MQNKNFPEKKILELSKQNREQENSKTPTKHLSSWYQPWTITNNKISFFYFLFFEKFNHYLQQFWLLVETESEIFKPYKKVIGTESN